MEACVRADPRTATRERIGFVPRHEDRQVFACLHEPATEPVGGVLLCSSILNDFPANYQREVRLGRALAERGLLALRYHPYGMGDSDGDPAEVTVESLEDDARWAAGQLGKRLHGQPVGFVGTRWGAFAAAAAHHAAERHPAAPLALIEPISDVRRYFREASRSRALTALTHGSAATAGRRRLDDALDQYGWIEVVGNAMHRALYASATARDALADLGTCAGPALVVQFGGDELRADHAALTDRLRRHGATVEHRVLDVEESWWFRQGPSLSQDGSTSTTVADWLAERLTPEGSS